MKKVLNTHCYQANMPLASMRYDGEEEDVTESQTTAEKCLTTHEKCFDESAEHKTIPSNFCLECIIGLLQFEQDGLFLYCSNSRKEMKIIEIVTTCVFCFFFVKLFLDSYYSIIISKYQICLAILCSFLCEVCVGEYICTVFL